MKAKQGGVNLRTAIAMIGFGITINRFSIYLFSIYLVQSKILP